MVTESEFMKVFRSSPVPMSLSRVADGKFSAVNNEFLRLSGYTTQEILGKTTLELDIWVDPSAREAIHQRIQTHGVLRSHELEVRRKDGSILTVLWSADIVAFQEEPHLLVSAYDITERKATEVALRKSETLFRSIVDSAPIGMHFYEIVDNKLVLRASNPASDRISGIETASLIGKSIEEAFPPLAKTEIPAAYMGVARGGQPWSESGVEYQNGGSTSFYDVHAFHTGSNSMCVMFTEVTERIQAEQEHQILQDRLRIAQKMEAIGHLAGGIAHDFNNLLSPIMGYTELALTEHNLNDAARQDLTEVIRAAERAKALINQLLAFSRKQVLEVKTIDLCKTIDSFMNVLRHTIREEISITIDNRIECGCVRADVGQIEQILLNLAINAQDAIESSGTITISLDHYEASDSEAEEVLELTSESYVVLSVQDSGPGIPLAIRNRLFEPFFTTKDPGKGTGLGLSTVYGIIKQHGGAITVKNADGGGALFSVYLPEVEDCDTLEDAVDSNGAASKGSGQILLVEDDQMVREMTERMLRSRGYEVLVCEDPLHAVTQFESCDGAIDLLLTDVVMPGMSGKEIFERLKLIDDGLKVLFMSGYENSVIGDRENLEEGANFIQKPFTLINLTEKVSSIIKKGE